MWVVNLNGLFFFFVQICNSQKNTVYHGFQDDDAVVQNFWAVLSSFTSEQQELFLRFASGKSRLPLSASNWKYKFTLQRFYSVNPDQVYPVARMSFFLVCLVFFLFEIFDIFCFCYRFLIADTCLFTLDLPKYSSIDILREKLVFAINESITIDTDFDPRHDVFSELIEN